MFHEDWYSDRQIEELKKTINKILYLEGSIVEIGCWEGRSTIAIANMCYPELVEAVDTWKGNYDEDPDHPSVKLAEERDIYKEFCLNIKIMTKGNIIPFKQDCFDFLSNFSKPIKFCHIDASHDYFSVKKTIEMVLPNLVNEAIICGDDFGSGNHKKLFGGVKRAVKEMCPGYTVVGRFWSYQYKG